MRSRVVLVGIDGLSWNLLHRYVKDGLLPNFEQMLENGAWGDLEVTSAVPGLPGAEGGLISPVLWTTAATGQYYFQHGIYDFRDFIASPEHPLLFSSQDVKSPRIWDILTAYDLTSIVVGYYVTHPATPLNGYTVSDLFGEVGSGQVVYPAEYKDVLAQILGAPDYQSYLSQERDMGQLEALQSWDASLDLRDAQQRTRARSILKRFTDLPADFVDSFFEESQSGEQRQLKALIFFRLLYPFCRDERFHRLFTHLLEIARRFHFASVYYRMVDFTSHGFWTEENGVSIEFRQSYQRVLPETYQLMDSYLGDILAMLLPDDRLIVISDHGFVGQSPPNEETRLPDVSYYTLARHESPGVFLAYGGPVRRGLVQDVSILDIVPTILDLFEIPQAESLDGGVIPGLLHSEAPRALPRIPQYPFQRAEVEGSLTSEEEIEILKRLEALGYING